MPALSAVNGSNGWSNGWSHGNHHDFKPATIDLHESPATDGTRMRSVPELIQYNAETNPKTLFCYQATKPAEGSDPDAPPPVAAVTMRQLRDAVWRCARRLEAELGLAERPAEKSAPVALFMDSDLGLLIHLFSLMALGVPVSPTS